MHNGGTRNWIRLHPAIAKSSSRLLKSACAMLRKSKCDPRTHTKRQESQALARVISCEFVDRFSVVRKKGKEIGFGRTNHQTRPPTHLPFDVRAQLCRFVGWECERASGRWTDPGDADHDLQRSDDGRLDRGHRSRRSPVE